MYESFVTMGRGLQLTASVIPPHSLRPVAHAEHRSEQAKPKAERRMVTFGAPKVTRRQEAAEQDFGGDAV
jgi:hypothetical protein